LQDYAKLKFKVSRILGLICLLCGTAPGFARAPLVMLTDFGTQDGAVSAMKGVAYR